MQEEREHGLSDRKKERDSLRGLVVTKINLRFFVSEVKDNFAYQKISVVPLKNFCCREVGVCVLPSLQKIILRFLV